MDDFAARAPTHVPELEFAIHPLVALARRAVETWVTEHRVIDPPAELTPEMAGRAGVFVSIKKRGMLRGCIGTFEPSRPSVAEETIQNAISSATRDPRFPPVMVEELPQLEYTVDVLTPPERVESEADLDPKHYGVIVRSGFRRGLLLPDLEGVNTTSDQISIAKQKAGISPRERVELYRFAVQRYK